jgi:C-terminal processing protease CtpA/Prc
MAYEIDIDLCYHNDFVGKEISLETQQKTPKIQRSNLFVEKVVLNKTNACQIWGVKYLTLGKKTFIENITSGSLAEEFSELRNGDQILSINGIDITKITELEKIVLFEDKNNYNTHLQLQVQHDYFGREFQSIEIERSSLTKPMGMAISSFYENDGGVIISKLNLSGAAYTDSNEQLKLGQQIVKVNGQNLVGATYSETVSAFRKTEESYIIDLLVFDTWRESNKSIC